MASDSSLYLLDLDRLYLEIDPDQQSTLWQQSQGLGSPTGRWNAYLNSLGFDAVATWLRSEQPSARVRSALPLANMPSLWQWFNGTALNVNDLRLVLLPTEAIDDDELRVPQEWVDIPSWVGDYYVSLQVNVDDGYVKVVGFATHQLLKGQGDYDSSDRTYTLAAKDLTTDVNVIWISQSLYPEAIKRLAVEPLPKLTTAQTSPLIERLSQSFIPRLAVSFPQWAAIMAHSSWRRQLSQRLSGQRPPFSVRQWLQSGVDQLAQNLGWQTVTYQLEGARGEASDATQIGLSRSLQIDDEDYTLAISCLDEATQAWRFELQKTAGLIAPGITLQLLTEDLQSFENNAVTATTAVEKLFVDVALTPNEGLVWAIDPTPDQYEPEVLYF